MISDSKPTETDENYIQNNVLHPSDIKPKAAETSTEKSAEKPKEGLAASTTSFISSIAPGATTAGMVGSIPKEGTSKDVPGAFIETPANEEKAFSVNPIPASEGVGNPIDLKPGESVPHHSEFTTNTVNSGVKLDKESYEKADAGPASDIVAEANKSTPVVGGTIIPESALPMGEGGVSPFIQSSGAGTTTAAMVGELPKENVGVPEVVSESQTAAKVDPEASANPEAVEEKKEVESELKSKVPEEKATSDGSPSAGGIAGAVGGGVAAVGAAATGAALATHKKATEAAKPVTDKMASTTGAATSSTPASSVPNVVSESIEKAHQSPEAAANAEAVAEKKAVESEFLKHVPKETQSGEPAPTITAATTETAPTTGTTAPKTDTTVPKTETTAPTTEAGPATPKKDTTSPAVASASTKKKNRASIFGKIKAKIDEVRHKDKKEKS
ncbi:hypothetical protein BT63DRAFT_126085 [Microthyrium microscopicum]|uniref:Uncharacterized protein n=1 Tax=Microthyrium microscopicum TaxID=703497 RepID=A0A6A6TWZ5_9PEZI|nr:hypothetical protein BT63DRAFT_126085 [Microthyrium microscopicum]